MRQRLSSLGIVAVLAVPACSAAPPPPPEPSAPPAPVASVPTPRGPKPTFENPGGMWPPSALAEQAGTLKKLGLALDPAALSDPMAFPLGAIVSLGNCSASFVSADGLLLTNHHCATAALQFGSTPKENLLEDGFSAKARGDERWNGPTSRVYVTRAFRDVTADVRAGLKDFRDDLARAKKIEERTKALVLACEKGKPGTRCDVVPFFGGAEYKLVERLEIRDVRLVFAPPASIGHYGGEIDNWRWPRHSGDFTFFRAYVGKDGKPADYAPDNVPYKPPQRLKLATTPLEEGDLVLVAGYPVQTNRLRTSAEVEHAVSWEYPHRVKLYEDNIALLEKIGATDAELGIKAASFLRSLNNNLTKTKGLLDGLVKDGLAARKAKVETELKAFILADPERKAKAGTVFDGMARVLAVRQKTREADAALEETLRLVRLVEAAHAIVRMAEERPKADAERDPAYQERNWARLEQEQVALQRRYDRRLDTALLKLALRRSALRPKAERTPLIELVAGKGEAKDAVIERAVDKLYAGTRLEDQAVRLRLLRMATLADLKGSSDSLLKLAFLLRPLTKAAQERDEAYRGAMVLLRPLFAEALRAFSKEPVAPDANGTLRVTFGTVKGYRPTPESPVFRPFSTVSELAKKATGKDPFNAPAPLLSAIRARRFGPYAARELGEVPVDFLADLDITGGNSGSATLNARGELVGAVFDGNYESMASDWLFMPSVTRSIHMDIRYALWLLDEVYKAEDLLKELRAP